jgi:PAS domain S-box-containing protein
MSEPPFAPGDRARLLLDSIHDYAILLLDPSGQVCSWNPGAERLAGYRAEEILGRHFSTFYPPEDVARGRCEQALRHAALQGRFEEEGWRLRQNGELFWAHVILTAIRDGAGALVGFSEVTRDRTERHRADERLRQSEERFRLMVDSVKDYAIFMLDTEGRVRTWNNGAARLKGYTAREIIGEHFSRFYPPEDIVRGKPDLELQVATAEGRFEEEGWRLRKEGTLFWANVVLTAMRDASGTLVGFAKVTRDLTERREAEEERIRLAQSQEAVRLRDEFLAVASHELKTPVTALQLQLQGLKRGGSGLDRALRSTQRLADLIETLFDVARLSSGHLTLNLERFELVSTVHDVLERLCEAAARAGCPVHFQAGPPIEGVWDRLRVEQVLVNLLSNAFKYAAGGHVVVSLAREPSGVCLILTDTGPGIPVQALSRLFGRFERAAPLRHYGGLGLGLYVTRQIVEAHGGSISVSNPSEGGARFTVHLPLEARATTR